jgi:hypothetical protein
MTRYNPYPLIKLEYSDIINDTRYHTAKEAGLVTDEVIALFKNYNVCSALLEPKYHDWMQLGVFNLTDFVDVSTDQNYLVEYLNSSDFPASIAEGRASIERIINMTEDDVQQALENGAISPRIGLYR